MEFGSSAQLQCGGNIIGVSWTTPSHAPMADATQLITTSNTRVQIHAADDQRIIASWITRPGSANRFVVAAVQHRSSRQLFAVQDGSRLLTWNERQSSLDAAVTTLVRKEVYALRVSKHASAVFVIYRDGGVSVYSLKLEELFYAPGVEHTHGSNSTHAARQGKGKGGKAQEATEAAQPIATWARLTSIPTEPGKLILLVAVQQTASAAGGAGSLPPTLLRVFTATPSKQQAGMLPVTFEHRASHSLSAPAGSPSGCRASSLTLHKHFHALTVLWSTGTMQVWRFQKAHNVSAGAQWYMAHPQVVLSRELGTQAPGSSSTASSSSSSSSAPAAPPSLRVASFALEPSCLVLAGAGTSPSGQQAVIMTVWDVRYGVILGTKEVSMHAGEGEGEVGGVATGAGGRGGKRMRSSSTGSIGSATGSLPKTAAVVAGSDLTPSDVFQVSVNEDGSYVACVSRASVLVTPVAVRGASLASALGRLPGTVAALHADEARATAGHHHSCIMDLDSLLSGSTSSAAGDGVLTGTSKVRWAAAVEQGAQQVQKDVEAVTSAEKTPTVASLAAVLSKYGVYVPQAGEGGSASGKGGVDKKRARQVEEEARVEGVAQGLPYAVAVACMQRAAKELQSSSQLDCMLIAAPLLTALTAHKATSIAACPAILPALLHVAALPPLPQEEGAEEGRPAAHPSSVTSLVLLSELLLACVDVPEAALLTILQAALHKVSKQALAGLWAKVTAAAQRAAGMGASSPPSSLPHHVNPSILGLLYVTSLVVRAPRNDVFMEAALAALDREDVRTLFACLLRLLHMHSNAFVHVRPVLSAESLDELIGWGGKGGKGKAKEKAGAEEAGGDALAGVPREALTMAPRPGFAHGKAVPQAPAASQRLGLSASPSNANPLAAHLPSHGQVLDWLRMTLDAHFTRVVLMAKADRDTEGSKKSVTMYALLLEVSRVVQADVSLAGRAAPVRGHMEHLLQRQALPVEQERDYSVAIIRV